MDDGTSGREAEAVRTGRLEALAPGQAIPFAGDRVAYVAPELAAAFRPGDRLVVVQDTGDLLHVPAREQAAADAAVGRAAAAFARMGEVGDAAITAFFEAFARRLQGLDRRFPRAGGVGHRRRRRGGGGAAGHEPAGRRREGGRRPLRQG